MAKIKDSGERREFETGAVRDMASGKGVFYVAPLKEMAYVLSSGTDKEFGASNILTELAEFQKEDKKNIYHLKNILGYFSKIKGWSLSKMMLEVSHQYEDGMEKYGEYNWQKGIPLDSYLDSAIRHLLKDIEGLDDERHDRAFVWNILCMMWQATNEEENSKGYRETTNSNNNSV